MAYQEKQLQDISKQFQIYGEILHAETFKIGHINETYSATYDQGGMRVRYIHQKINKNVFKNPPAVMKNVMRVTTHIRRKLEAQNARDITRRSLIVIPTRDGQSLLSQPRRRILAHVCVHRGRADVRGGAIARPGVSSGPGVRRISKSARGSARRAAARNHPDFHNTRKRFAALQQAIEKDHYQPRPGRQAGDRICAQARADGGRDP